MTQDTDRRHDSGTPGTGARRQGPRALVSLRTWQARHPALWASRHVVLSVLGVLGTLLGVSVLVRLLLDKVLPDVEIDIPKPDLPDWLQYLDPLHYLRPVLERLAGLVPDIDLTHGPPWLKIAVALLVALGVSVREYKRRTRDREERERREGQDLSGEDG